MNLNNKTVETLFAQALNFKPLERSAFLAGACGNDTELRRRVEELLQAQAEAGEFMPTEPGGAAALATSLTEGHGAVIGRYKLLHVIGEGGMGIVYMAEQQEPIKRRVALKIIKLGMDTKQVIARFESERQALAMMDHPNIAKVFDAGATGAGGAESQISNLRSQIPQGRPYFVIELVQGVSITEFCDKNHLTARSGSRCLSPFVRPFKAHIRRASFIATSSPRMFSSRCITVPRPRDAPR